MFINNLTGKPIIKISFEGFWFTIPAGISVCWDKFGEFLLRDIYKLDGVGGGIPPVVVATAKQWKGILYTEVNRFEIDSALIPSLKDLLKIAKARGVDVATLEAWREDEAVDRTEIVKTINELPVPDYIKYPVVTGEETPENSSQQIADEVINTPPAGPVATTVTPPVVGDTKAPTTARKSGNKAKTQTRKAAAKAPTTKKPDPAKA